MINLGEKFEVIYGENINGDKMKEEMTLLRTSSYKGEKISVFEDSTGYDVATYNHGEEIDWDFMREINDKFA